MLGLLLGAAGCSSAQHAATVSPPTPAVAANPNGRDIFATGKDIRGASIVARHPPLMHSCAACHRPDGAGGVHLPGGAVSADLRHAALVTHQKHPYTVALLERAISTGIDNEGKPLDPVMPRWQLSKRDLNAVSVYVYTQLR